MNNVVLSRKLDTYLQLENWLKTVDDIVQHHLRMHTLVTQSFLLLASFASDWRSALSIDLGFTRILKRIGKFANEESVNSKKTPSLFSTFPCPATSANQPLLSNLVQLQHPQSLKIWEPKCSDTWNTLSIDIKVKIFQIFSVSWSFGLGTFSQV